MRRPDRMYDADGLLLEALSLGNCGHLRTVRALIWANVQSAPFLGSTVFTVVPRWSPLDLVR
ncbi:hypothetical protein GCM10023086_26720 [Streptomyces venetus]|uniref:Uncharacterized protein n=1 Tax=Streptomyces venetus TaxID=1701086 RepID=A0ABP8FP53_9ACTN